MTDIEQAIQPEEQQQSGPPHYEYKVLSDILYGDIPTECNFYAIIDECSVKRPTKRKGAIYSILTQCKLHRLSPSLCHRLSVYLGLTPGSSVDLQTGCAM